MDQRIIEYLRLEGTYKDHHIQLPGMYPIPSPKEVPPGEIKFEFVLRLGPTTQSLWWQYCPCPLTVPVHSPVPVILRKCVASIVVFSARRGRRDDHKPILLPAHGPCKTTAVGDSSLLLKEPVFLHRSYKA